MLDPQPAWGTLVCLAVYLGPEEIDRLLASVRDNLDVFEASTIDQADRVRRGRDGRLGVEMPFHTTALQATGSPAEPRADSARRTTWSGANTGSTSVRDRLPDISLYVWRYHDPLTFSSS